MVFDEPDGVPAMGFVRGMITVRCTLVNVASDLVD